MGDNWIFKIALLILITSSLMAQESIFEPTNGYKGGQLFEFTTHGNTLYALSLDGVIRSEDGGDIWQVSLDLPLDEAYYENTLKSLLVSNDSIIFVSNKARIDDELTSFLKYSSDDGETWLPIDVPDDISIYRLNANNQYLYINNGQYYVDLLEPTFSFQLMETPQLTNLSYFYQGDYCCVYNSDSLYFSTDNVNWVYKPLLNTSWPGLAIIQQDLYIAQRNLLLKTGLRDDVTYILLDSNTYSRDIISRDSFLYYQKSGKVIEMNTVTGDTLERTGYRWGSYSELLFTDEYVFVHFDYSISPTNLYEISYSPIGRFNRFTDVQSQDIMAIRSSLDRENTYKLVTIGQELFSCNVQGLHRYDELENEWHFIETPMYETTNIAWHNGYYFVTSSHELYRTSDFENWEQIYTENATIHDMLTYRQKIFFFGLAYLTSYDEILGAVTINETASMGNGGDYPGQGRLSPPIVYNDTLIMMQGGKVKYSADSGQNWEQFNSGFQTHHGFLVEENVYYFNRYSQGDAHVVFAKKNKEAAIALSDYSTIYSGTHFSSEMNLLSLFYFLKSEELLFFALPTVGVIYSNDDGESWQLLSNDISLLHITSMAATEEYVYFASKQNGIKRMRKDEVTSFTEVNKEFFLKIFPNPAFDVLYVNGSQSGKILDLTGRCVSTFDHQNEIDISGLIKGVYFVQFENENGLVLTFVKQ